MNVDAPSIAKRVFARLSRGENLIVSANGPGADSDLYRQIEDEEEPCQNFFAVLGFRLKHGDNCYYFTTDDEPTINLETKLDRLIRLTRQLDFLSTQIESFSEGVVFSATTLAARCSADPKAERFLQDMGKGANYAERLDSLLQSLVRQGYLSEYDSSRQEYRVLSAINYLFEFADRIKIYEDEVEGVKGDVQT